MKKKLSNIWGRLFVAGMLVLGMNAVTGCNPEPDESDMYTSTGETADDFIKRKPELSSFHAILSRVGLNRNLSSYGEYTCFVPNNDAIKEYIDSLWRDPEAVLEHNGLSENSLKGLIDPNNKYSDSLCNDIAKYHLANGVNTSVEMGTSSTIRTMLGRKISTALSAKYQGLVAIEQEAVIIEPDSVVTNGVVHVLNRVIPRSNRLLSEQLGRFEEYSIFMEALTQTHLADSLNKTKKDEEYTIDDHKDTDGADLYWPDECLMKYTIFAEPDEVLKPFLRKNGFSEDFNGLVAYANKVYEHADEWYDMLAETGLWSETEQAYVKTVSTGNDYTSRNNALNMFVAYHILYAGMPVNELVFEKNSRFVNVAWNYTNGCTPFDYYETMLPHTLMKIWKPSNDNSTLYINRYVMNNTLTDVLPSSEEELGVVAMGSEAMHRVIRTGVRIVRSSTAYRTNQQAYNGYIHAVQADGDRLLVYDELVPKGVLHERLRFDSTTFLPEFINNGIRMSTSGEVSALNGGGSGARVAFPLNYFDNVVSYTKENRFRYNVKGGYNAWQGDTFQGWGNYDLAIKLPPLPTGVYEFRVFYTPMSHGGMMMFYIGDNSKLSSMVPLDIPLDVRIPKEDPRIGLTQFVDEEDYGVATDAALRNRGYMRGLYSYKDHPGDSKGVAPDDPSCATTANQRSTTSNASLRKIMKRDLEVLQSGEKWFRIKNVIPDETDLKWQFDYVEFVPLDVVGNTVYSEDWF